MATIAQDFSSFAGEDTVLYIDVTDGSGSAVALTTVTEITFKAAVDFDTAAFATITKTSGNITIGDQAGTDDRISVVIAGSHTTAFASQTVCRWDCYITDASGNDRYVASGNWTVRDSL